MLDDLQRHQSLLSSQQRLQELFLSKWNAVSGPRWSRGGEHISSLLPDDLTADQRRTAMTEMKAIPEYFYRYTGLPIISPANATEFMQNVKSSGSADTVISLFSGSGRLLLTLMNDPHHLLGLPPIDLRHGWNIGQRQHQQLIDQLYSRFKPAVTIAEPRCKHWSKSGNRRDPVLTQSLRDEELPTLRYLSKRIVAEVNQDHQCLLENPKGSAIWWDSPLASLEWHNHMKRYHTCQCHYMRGIPDGERHKKETSLLTNMKLKQSIAYCTCTRGHIQLQGTDTHNHVSRTAAAALFPHRFCQALSTDIVSNLEHQAHQHKKHHYAEEVSEPTSSSAAPAFAALPRSFEDIQASSLRLVGHYFILPPEKKDDLKRCLGGLLEIVSDNIKGRGALEQIFPFTTSQEMNYQEGIVYLIETLQVNFITRYVYQVRNLSKTIKFSAQDSVVSLARNVNFFGILIQLFDNCVTIFVQTFSTLERLDTYYSWEAAGLLLLGEITLAGRNALFRPRLSTPTPDTRWQEPDRDKRAGPEQLAPQPSEADEHIRANGDRIKSFKPSQDFKQLPQKLIHASKEERRRLLQGLHERLWHCGPQDMLRFLTALILPREVIMQGVSVCQDCKECRQYATKMARPLIKSDVALYFNEEVFLDLFFLWGEPFVLIIDAAIKWKTGALLPDRKPMALIEALRREWIRLFGPPSRIVSDQEGSMTSYEVQNFLEKLGITRCLVGTQGSHTKGLVERHIGLVKLSMLKMKAAQTREGVIMSHNDICQEVYMAQNLMLEYNGQTPQTALTGVQSKELWNLETDNIQATESALDLKPDVAELAIRTRMLAKQCILQSIVEERLALARKMKQQKHPPSLLVPGMLVDVYRSPAVKRELAGWHGPGELLSIQRHAGAAIVLLHGQPLMSPLNSIRRHVPLGFYVQEHLHSLKDNSPDEFYCNYEDVRDYQLQFYHDQSNRNYITGQHTHLSTIMDLVEGESHGRLFWIGWRMNDKGTMEALPDEETVSKHSILLHGNHLRLQDLIGTLHGVIFGHGLKRIPVPRGHRQGLLLRWKNNFRKHYTMEQRKLSQTTVFTSSQVSAWNTLYFYSYVQPETDPEPPLRVDTLDWDDISSIDPSARPPSAPDMSIFGPPGLDPIDENDEQSTELNQAPPPPGAPPGFPPGLPPALPSESTPQSMTGMDDSMNPSEEIIADPPPDDPGPPQPPMTTTAGNQPPDSPDLPQLKLQVPRSPMHQPLQPGPQKTPSSQLPPKSIDIPPALPPEMTGEKHLHPRQPLDRRFKNRTLERSVEEGAPRKHTKILDDNDENSNMSHTDPDSDNPGNLPFLHDPHAPRPPMSTAQSSQDPLVPQEPRSTTGNKATGISESLDRSLLNPSNTDSQTARDNKQQASASTAPAAASSSTSDLPGIAPSPAAPTAADLNDSNETLDPDATLDYGDSQLLTRAHSELTSQDRRAAHTSHTLVEKLFNLFSDSSVSDPFHTCLTELCHGDTDTLCMLRELSDEFTHMFTEHFSDIQLQQIYYLDLVTNEVFRVDDETANLSDEEMRKFASLVHEGDRKELAHFIDHHVFIPIKTSTLPSGTNLVDCVWIRKWKVKNEIVKSRVCARGCFDRQKNIIERHSSTASRLSQRIVLSAGMIEQYLYGESVDTESLDISCAFLQGLRYSDLRKLAKELGYEQKGVRSVCITPPENVWRHFRAMDSAPPVFHISDEERGEWSLKALKAMYGFSDAPLMFQLALLQFLVKECGATKSLFDSNFLYWTQYVHGESRITLMLTAHVDDLQITGSQTMRTWLHHQLTRRFGELKRQVMPYTHAGIQLERLSQGTLRLHQDHFCSKLETSKLDDKEDPERDLRPDEQRTFRSLTCAVLWACQTNNQELCQVTQLQQHLTQGKLKHLISINGVIKRLKSPSREAYGIYLKKLTPPLRVVCVSDASSANKKSSYATEGICVLLAEDKVSMLHSDKNDFLEGEQVKNLGGAMHLLVCSSTKAKRISHCTSHAETNACSRAIPIAELVSLRISEPEMKLYADPEEMTPMRLLHLIEGKKPWIPIDCLIDCMDLWELSCGRKGIPQDKSQRLGVLAIREERRSERIRRFFHVTTHYMLCDLLTKYSGYFSKSLQELLTCGCWTVDGKLRVRHKFGQSAEWA